MSRDGARARVNESATSYGGTKINGTVAAYRVGKGAAIGQGSGAGCLLDPVTWAGNFTRRLEAVGGYPTDDDSRIWDVGWEPTGYHPDIGYVP